MKPVICNDAVKRGKILTCMSKREKKMAERVESGNETEVTDESKARKRKPKFSVNEISVIAENVKNHLAVIQSKLTNNITN